MAARTVWRRTATLAVVYVGLCVPARAETFPECAERAYAQAASASQEWQHSLRDVLAKVRPDLATLATLEMKHQLALIERRHAQFRYLLRTNVGRVHTREGLAMFRNFDWTEADARVLRQQSSSYVAIERTVVELERQGQARRGWPAMREYVPTSLNPNPQFQDCSDGFRSVNGGSSSCSRVVSLSRETRRLTPRAPAMRSRIDGADGLVVGCGWIIAAREATGGS